MNNEDADHRDVHKVLPDVWVLKIGGQSLMDRGAAAIHPILEELVAAKESGDAIYYWGWRWYSRAPRIFQSHGVESAHRDAG